jgi:outer membrane receptor protein involved in Fe transport
VDVFVAYRHAFRAPSEGQLFRQGTARDTIDLKPIRADNVEVGLRLRPATGVSIDVSAYQLDKRDDVLSYRNPVDGATEAVNAGHTRHRGVEIGLTARPASWLDVSAGYSRAKHTYEEWVVDPRLGVDYSGREMETAPRDLGNLLVGVSPTRRGRVSLELVHLGRYWMDAANTQAYDGHTLLNARAMYELRRGVRVYARMLNLADTRYAESASFTLARGRELAPGAPRSAFFGVTLGR